jgi:hypothetical protein
MLKCFLSRHARSKLVAGLAALALIIAQTPVTNVQAADPAARTASTTDTPDTVASDAASFTLSTPKLFWHEGAPPCTPSLAAAVDTPDAPDSQAQAYSEAIKRVSSDGGQWRVLYTRQVSCGENTIQSNLAADSEAVYWVGAGGVMKLSVEANPEDSPTVLDADVNTADATRAEIVVNDLDVFVLKSTQANTKIFRISKVGGGAVAQVTIPIHFYNTLKKQP